MSGIPLTNRVDGTTERKLYAKVVDNILNSRVYGSRLLSRAKPFVGKSMDFTLKVTNSNSFEWFSGLETLNSAASDTTITLSYRHTGGTQPQVSVMLESFANAGEAGTINLDTFKYEEAVMEAAQSFGSVIFSSTGTSNQPLGLAAIVDDGTNVSTIGGQSRTSYPALNATVTASDGTISLAKMATLHDNVSAAGLVEDEPNIFVTTKTVWSLVEQLIHPQLRNNYNVLPIRGDNVTTRGEMGGKAGFTALEFRGRPIIKDDAATAQTFFALNEKSFGWFGRTIVPDDYKGKIEKVNLGTAKTVEGTGYETLPSEYAGWFYQPLQSLPNQAGMIARLYIIGQQCAWAFRRNGRLTGITGV